MTPLAVYGPPLDLTSAADAANAGLSGSYLLALTSGKDKPVPMTLLTCWVDVSPRDDATIRERQAYR